MKIFLIDLHRGLAGFGPAASLLYPLRESGELRMLEPPPAAAASMDLSALAPAVVVELIREYAPRWLAIFLVDLPAGERSPDAALAGVIQEIRDRFVSPLGQRGLGEGRVVVVTLDSLSREPHTGAPHDPAAHGRWAADVRRLGESPALALGDVTVVRFELRRGPAPVFRQDLARLVYLLLAITEDARGADAIPRGQLLHAQEVALDRQRLAAWMDRYIACLRDGERAVAHRLEHAEPVTLHLVRDANCGCAQALTAAELPPLRFGWLRDREDVARWRGWARRMGEAIEGRDREAARLLDRCTQERSRRTFRPIAEPIAALDDETQRLAERLDAAERDVLEADPPPESAWSWQDEIDRRTPHANGLIDSRPRKRAFFVTVAVFLVLLLPALVFVPGVGYARLVAPGLLLVAGSVGVTAAALVHLRNRLDRAAGGALESGRRLIARIGERFDGRRRHIERLCELEAARHNAAAATTALAERRREVMLLKYHRAELRHHLDLAILMQATVPANPGDPDDAAIQPAAPAAASRDWRTDRPPHRHPSYSPARCAAGGSTDSYELRLGARHLPATSPLIVALRHVRLVEDPLFRPPPQAPLAATGDPERPRGG